MEQRLIQELRTSATVLVVDDDAAIVEFIETALVDAGYAVLTAVGEAALALAHAARPAVILLDIMMPDMDGVEVSQRLRADPETAGIPIIVMSALDRLQAMGVDIPVNDRLPKPFRLRTLYETVARWAAATS